MAEEKEASSEKKAGLSPAQVMASALAAVTAAFLGSTLGVAGTVIGAGVASVVTTVGSELYLRSLRRTRMAAKKTAELLAVAETRQRTKVVPPSGAPRSTHPLIRHQQNAAAQRRQATQLTEVQRPGARWQSPQHADQQPDQQRTRIVHPVAPPLSGATRRIPQPSRDDEKTVFFGKPVPEQEEPPAEAGKPWWKNRWTLIGATSVAAFIVGMLVITGFEAATGSTVSGGEGTTLGRVVGGGSGGHVEPTTPTEVTPETTGAPSAESSAPSTTRTTPTPTSAGQEQSEAPATTTPRTSAPETESEAPESAPTTAPTSPE